MRSDAQTTKLLPERLRLSPKRYAIDQRTKVAAKASRHRSSHVMTGNAFTIDVGGIGIHGHRSGSGPPILLLHGFPQTHVMWRQAAELLAERFTVICADLRGYGQSGCPPSSPDHSAYSKRAMAEDMVEVMARLGFRRFHLAGHDRGGRVAYRLALDHPQSVASLAVLDVIPILEVWELADRRIAEFWPFSLLAQPEPLPERMILGAPEAVVDDALRNWGSPAGRFASEAREAYIKPLGDPAHVPRHLRGVSSGSDDRRRARPCGSGFGQTDRLPGAGPLERPRSAGALV
jgi:pimeloyl-ACP methyl ester carboxylesterase